MRYIIFALIAFIFFSCNSTGQKGYNKINSQDIKTNYVVDTKGSILDTFPTWLKIIKSYSFKDVDTSRIFLSDSKIALDFARLVLDPIFGQRKLDNERPFNVELIDNKFWYISGTFPNSFSKGGVVEILFSKYNCRILYLSHGK